MSSPPDIDDKIYRLRSGDGPLVATAIHDGHEVRPEVARCLALDEASRLREEDPFTGFWTDVAPTSVVVRRSRFEVDLNRPREKAIYRMPKDAWGLTVWKPDVPEEVFARSLDQYDAFYRDMRAMFDRLVRTCGRFVVYDLHSYCHRRGGPDAPPDPPEENPQINVGTGPLDRHRWGPVVDAFIESLRAFDFPGGRLDVRENVKFRGGHWSQWIHRTFPETGVALAIELKKFFMDEWTGRPDPERIGDLDRALRATVQPVLRALENL